LEPVDKGTIAYALGRVCALAHTPVQHLFNEQGVVMYTTAGALGSPDCIRMEALMDAILAVLTSSRIPSLGRTASWAVRRKRSVFRDVAVVLILEMRIAE
jgi:hypothetical protein